MKNGYKGKIKVHAIVFLKGLLMGAADIIPGVSGGTIALILGIYERFILAIYDTFDSFILWVESFFKREYKKELKKIFKPSELIFLIVLVAGIGSSFLLISTFILEALELFPSYVYSFFFGLILASALVIFKSLKNKKSDVIPGAIGFALAFFLAGIKTIGASHSPLIILTTGFVAACAMLLPGISGSFMVLFLGQYKFMLHSLSNLSSSVIATFLIGFAGGAFAMSKTISHFLKKYETQTMSFLVGLMFGALRLPLQNIVKTSSFWALSTVTLTILSGFVGVAIILLVEISLHKQVKTKV